MPRGHRNGDGTVTIDELIRGVDIALGSLDVASCPVAPKCDGPVADKCVITYLIQLVNNALYECPSL